MLSLAFSLSWLVLALNGRAFFLLSLFHSLGFQFRVENVDSFIGIWLCGITVDWSLLLSVQGVKIAVVPLQILIFHGFWLSGL